MMPVRSIDMIKAVAVWDFVGTRDGQAFLLSKGRIGMLPVEEIFDEPKFIEYFEKVWIPDKEKRGLLARTLEGLYVFDPNRN